MPLQIGDRVRRPASGEEGVVLATTGEFLEVAFPSGTVWVHPDDLQVSSRNPAERLLEGEVSRSLPYGLRLQAIFLKHAYKYDPLSGLSNARIEPTLHQIYVAHTVTQKLKPRMILADEVGLGKTIEAGLIIKELRARGLLDRVLIVCPASLQLQWQNELRSKFNEDFQILDGAAVKFLGRDGTNPWAKPSNVICSLPFASSARNAERIAEAEWDLVVFDEAHRVRRSIEGRNRYRTTQAYRLADDLKDVVNGLLLLTATPMQLHHFELYSLIELVEPGLYLTSADYDRRRRDLPKLNALMRLLKGWAALTEEERKSAVEHHEALLASFGLRGGQVFGSLDDPAKRSELIDLIVGSHPLAGVLVRNRKAEIGGFTRREAHRFLVTLSAKEAELYHDVTAYLHSVYNMARASKNLAVGFVMVIYQKMLTSSSHAIRQSLTRRVTRLRAELPENENRKQEIRNLEDLRDEEEQSAVLAQVDYVLTDEDAVVWEIGVLDKLIDRLADVRDSKAAELLKVLRIIFEVHLEEKVLIFTQFIETQEFLSTLLEDQGYRVASFNGQMKLEEKEDAVAQFRRDAQIMVSTEAGGEGRNFQFCHIMVNYDLPWNPMKVEQRIGRLDRIGQRKPVYIYNLACAGTIEERVLRVLEHRIGLFEESVGSLDPILGEVEKNIEHIVMGHATEEFDPAFDAFEQEVGRRVRDAQERERTLADFVLDRASLRRDLVDELLGRVPLARHADLREFVREALDYYGGKLSEHAEGGQVISLSPKLATHMETRRGVIRGCFDWKQAQDLEHLDFFAFGHEIIDKIVDLPLRIQPAITGFRRIAGAPKGLAVEIFYQIRNEGIRPTGRIIRHTVSENLDVLSETVEHLPPIGAGDDEPAVPKWVRSAVLASQRRFREELADERKLSHAENEKAKRDELVRTERIYRYRKVRLEKLIDEHVRWIAEKERSGTERDRRILPARRGRLAKERERLERLRFEYDREVAQIRSRQPAIAAEIIAAGLVSGE